MNPPFRFPRRAAAVALLAAGMVCAHAAIQPQPVSLPSPAERFGDPKKAEDPSFRRHVVPLLSRTGCSNRECHGAFSGQGGFQLSLFGYDFEKDHQELTADAEDGPRVELQDPVQSLLLLKPTMQEKHKGKERFKVGSWEYELLRKWVRSGAKNDAPETGEFDRLEVTPREIVFRQAGDAVQLRVVAHWKDGAVEDVTQLTRFRTNDESVAVVSDTGRVESKERGDTHIVAFYDNGVLPIPAMLPVSDRTGAKYPKVATRTKVDELVVAKLRKVGIVPSEVCTDAEFLRRVSLDLTATLPTPTEVEAFLADRAPDKRARKIDALLATPAYAAWWTTKLCDFTGNSPRQLDGALKGARNLTGTMSRQWYDWIYRRVAENTPYDQLAAGIILATGRTSPEQGYRDYAREMSSYFKADHPADFAARPNMPYYWQRRNAQKPEEKAMAFAHTFLGVRIECAQCHKHPFDQWTKTDFEQFQAFFAPVVTGNRPGPKDAPAGEDSFQSVMAEMRTAVGSAGEMMMQPAAATEPVMEGQPPAKPDPKKLAEQAKTRQKAEQDEAMKRLAAGDVLPWPELFIDLKRTITKKGDNPKNKAQGSSRVITPKILGGEEVMVQQYPDPREPLMAWLRDRENPYFARAFANRVWANHFGRGLVEPADDLNLANPPSNAELLEYLATGFASHGFDMRWLHREILASDTYQRSWRTNPTNKLDDKNFSRAVIRRLPAEVVADAISLATASTERAAKFATQITDRAIGPNGNAAYGQGGGDKKNGGDAYALTIFGKPVRETNCDCERTTDPTLQQTLYTRNDPSFLAGLESGQKGGAWIADLRALAETSDPAKLEGARKKLAGAERELAGLTAPEKPATDAPEALAKFEKATQRTTARRAEAERQIADWRARVAALEQPRAKFDPQTAIREAFLRTVSRPPTAAEFTNAQADVAAAATPLDGVRDLLWALLNSREFIVNH